MTAGSALAGPAPIVGWIDALGYLRCVVCVEPAQQDHAVRADSAPHNEEVCDTCGTPLVAPAPEGNG
jgi:hypothetical protein